MSASNDTKAGYTFSVYTIQSIQPTTTRQQQTLTNYPTQRKNERFVKHRDYPPHSYIVNEPKGQAKRKNSEWQEPATSPYLNPGRPRNCQSIELERTNFLHRYIMMKQTRLNWENKIKHPTKGRLPDEVQLVVKARVNTTKKTETPRT